MKDIILKYVIEQFGSNIPKEERKSHYSYCMFPEEDCTCKDLNEITYDTSLISGGYIDSFSMVVVLVFLQKTFNVKIPDKEAPPSNFDTVNKMVELVNKFKK
jgi:acyl carrier protein